MSLCPPPELGQAALANLGNAHRSGSRVGRPAGMALVAGSAALTSTQHPAAAAARQQSMLIAHHCPALARLAPVTGGSTHTHTHTHPVRWTLDNPPGQASPGLFFISSHVAAIRLSALPLLPPPQQATTRRNSNPSILASRVISLSQKIIATTALPLAHLSLLPCQASP